MRVYNSKRERITLITCPKPSLTFLCYWQDQRSTLKNSLYNASSDHRKGGQTFIVAAIKSNFFFVSGWVYQRLSTIENEFCLDDLCYLNERLQGF